MQSIMKYLLASLLVATVFKFRVLIIILYLNFELIPCISFFLSDAGSTSTLPTSLDLNANFLPSAFPSGDPSGYALPVYLQEPEDTFSARGQPGKLTCKVAHALRAYYVCNGDVMDSTSESQLVDPETSIRYTEVTLEVKRSEVLDVLDHYSCKCYASSSKGEVFSKEVVIKSACK